MGYVEHRDGALFVVRQAGDREWLTKELRKIDDRLFCELQVGFDQQPVWCVVCEVGGDVPPITLHEWRDEQGRPIPELSSGLLDRVNAMERDGHKLAAKAILANKQLIERGRQERFARFHDQVEEILPSVTGVRSVALHRGDHLRRSRDKLRARGWKV